MLAKYVQHEIGVRVGVDGCHGFITRTEDREKIYETKRYDDKDAAMSDAWEKWLEIKRKLQ